MRLRDIFGRWLPRRPAAEKLMAEAVRDYGTPASGIAVVVPTAVAPGIVAEAPKEAKQQVGNIGMVGYAPIVSVTKNRHGKKCRCGEVVLRGVRHICMFNADHHLHDITDEERAKVMAQITEANAKRFLAPVVELKPAAKVLPKQSTKRRRSLSS